MRERVREREAEIETEREAEIEIEREAKIFIERIQERGRQREKQK